MAKNTKKRVFRFASLALACTAALSVSGLASACSSNSDSSTDNDDKTTSKEDTQLLKNGNFEFFDVPDKKEDGNAPVYLINEPNNWSHGGSSSYTASGIIGVSEKEWAKFVDEGLRDKLDYNNDLKSDDDNYKTDYVDYNGLTSDDLLYKDTYAALNYEESDDEETIDADPRKEFIKNPETHYGVKKDDSGLYYTDADGKRVTVYEDTDEDSKTYGAYFLDEELQQPFSHVLMLHNYASEHNGIAQNYSSIEINLPANTAAEISVWVKTCDLFFNQGAVVAQDRGASISVAQTVGSSSIDEFAITCINTEKLLGGEQGENNGWVQYTVYVNACDFASSTISIKLGLGDSDGPVEGYAFFDDVTVKKFVSLEDENCSYNENKNKIGEAKCDLSSDASEKIFKADKYERNDGQISDLRFSKNFYYSIDLASKSDYKPLSFSSADKFKAGLTVDSSKYASAKKFGGTAIGLTPSTLDAQVKLPADFTELNTGDDLLAYVKAGQKFTQGQTAYYEKLTEALTTAEGLPNVSDDTDNNVLVMLSAHGAAYTASFQMNIEDNGYEIISFWVKTSDMKGNTAATVKIYENGNKDNSSSLSIDTTDMVTDIDDEHPDIYNGWAQYFFFVNNETETDNKVGKTFTVEFSFGNTTIKDTANGDYNYGWAALANVQYLTVDEDTFAYTSGGDNSASLTISEDEEKKNSVFDEAYGSQAHEIESGFVNPASYTGVNGKGLDGSVTVPVGTKLNAGLLNVEYVDNYSEESWYKEILTSFNASSLTAIENWQEVFGKKSVQPLIIVNSLREAYIKTKDANSDNYKDYYIKNEDGEFVKVSEMEDAPVYDETETYYSMQEIMNYGYVGADKTVSAESYATVSVKVKVSAGAKAYIYLAQTSAGNDLLTFNTPSYSFYYDEDGNVIKELLDDDATIDQKRANVLYTLRDDGLYEDKDGKLRANIYNYTKVYKATGVYYYYDKDGNRLSIDDVVDGNDYYNEDGSLANHFLATTDGVKVYEYKDGKYYYIVNGQTQTEEVLPFDKTQARYDYFEGNYFVEIDGTEPGIAGKWITVNFVLHAGSDAKSYRLELWSGERDKYITDGTSAGGTVIFDYSYTSVSSDDLRDEYEQEIITAYKKLIAENANVVKEPIASSEENISYYEKLAQKYDIDTSSYDIINNYKARYYTYSLYDSANFTPYNKEVADDDSTGYDYSISDYDESLAYLAVKDFDEDTNTYTYSVFADYSTTDQSISLDSASDSDTDDEETEDESSSSSIWLLVSSILLVIALLFAMLAIFAKDAIKKMRRNKVMGKNNYNHRATNRYMRKLRLQKEEFEEVPATDAPETDNTADTEQAEQPEEVEEAPAEVAPPAEDATPEETVEVEEAAEEPAEAEQPATETEEPTDGE